MKFTILSSYKFPPISLLEANGSDMGTVSKEELLKNKNRIVETFGNNKIHIEKITATIGPAVTLFEMIPGPGIRLSRIRELENDIALSLSDRRIRIILPVPGRGTFGIELPHRTPGIVSMHSVISSDKFQEAEYDLPVVFGKTSLNEIFVADLTRMHHLLIAGEEGQGKSTCLNAIITSLLYKKHPDQLKFVLIDPKKGNLTKYSRIEHHFMARLFDTKESVITETYDIIKTLESLNIEKGERCSLLNKAHVGNIKGYNDKFIARQLDPNEGHRYLPYIVVIIDEFADLIRTAGLEIETMLTKLARPASAIGIHLVIATHSYNAEHIKDELKASFPSRIAFRVNSMEVSRTILYTAGADKLIGSGDMLMKTGNNMIRLQCAFIDTPEIDRIAEFIGSQKGYPSVHFLPECAVESDIEPDELDLRKADDLFDEAARLVFQHQQGSTSLIQRKFSIGYNRAGRIIDQLEAAGIVGPFEGTKVRQVLFQDEDTLEQFLKSLEL